MDSLQEIPQITSEHLTQLCSSAAPSTDLVDFLADLEATAHLDSVVYDLLPTYYSAYMLALFLDEDLNEARFLLQRIPQRIKDDVSLEPAIQLLKALYTRKHDAIYSALASPQWSSAVAPLKDRFATHFRVKTGALLARAYTTLAPSVAASYLGGDGQSESEIVEALATAGWKYGEDGLLHASPGMVHDFDRHQLRSSGIGNLTSLVTHLTEG